MKKHVWSWPIASYLFLGGLGGGMSIIAAVADLFFGNGALFGLCPLVAFICLSLGCLLLIFELGVPKRFLFVFKWNGAVLNFGAWSVSILIVLNLIFFTFFSGWFSWGSAIVARHVIAILVLLAGCCVVVYTGIELSSMRGRVFWNTPVLPVLFAVSGLLTGTAADALCLGLWPYTGNYDLAGASGLLTIACAALCVLTLAIVLLYVVLTYMTGSESAKVPAYRLLKGSFANAFWVGLITIGLVAPLVLFALGQSLAAAVAELCIIVGGVFLRFLIVYSDDRRYLPGEAEYWEDLPTGDEPFMKSNWG